MSLSTIARATGDSASALRQLAICNVDDFMAVTVILYLRWAEPDDGVWHDNDVSRSTISLSPVPEPSVYMLLGVGILLCGQRFLRRKRA